MSSAAHDQKAPLPESEPRRFEYHLDADDRIAYVSPDFLAFARENDTPQLTASALQGQPIWKFIAGTSSHDIYVSIFQRVRAAQRPVSFPFRCDSPTRRRFMELTIAPGPAQALHLSSLLLRTEDRPAMPLLDPLIPRSGKMLEACCYCKSIRVPNAGWLAVEKAIQLLNLFDSPQLPALIHSVCDPCMRDIQDRLDL